MNADVESHIRQNHPWQKLPANIKQSVGNSQREYDKAVINFSVKNQLRYKGSLVRHIRKDERRYYEDMLQYSRDHLMLYPYHLSDVVVKGLRMTPFVYYTNMMQDIMSQEKSYDSLPNFTAADCLRLLGIGRNQYIDLMNQCRSSKKFFRKKPVRELLPVQPVESAIIESWWIIHTGYITEDDIKMCTPPEKTVIDSVIDSGPQTAGGQDKEVVHALYRKGLVYLDVSMADEDCIIVPPLEGFVMNRVLGDYFETLLYKIFVSIDENTNVAELASVLQIDLQLVKNAVSMYCRLGFAKKKTLDVLACDLHPSWTQQTPKPPKPVSHNRESLLIDLNNVVDVDLPITDTVDADTLNTNSNAEVSTIESAIEESHVSGKRIAFLFDSTLTAFLMMGNLSPGLKSHAVTMFEVGKLSDESMDSFLSELEKVGSDAEGEARRYFDHALTLRDTIHFLRHNKCLCEDGDAANGQGIDLLRCESLLSLESATRSRVLNKNYSLLVSMAPLSNEIRPVSSCVPPHIGPAIPEVSSLWFKLYIYHLTKSGPPSLLLVKGTKLRKLPSVFQRYERLFVTTWGHDPGIIATSNILLTLNDALTHSAVLVQGHGYDNDGETVTVTFPLKTDETGPFSKGHHHSHSAIQTLSTHVDLQHSCGYITLLNPGRNFHKDVSPSSRVTSPSNKSRSPSSGGEIPEKPTNGIKDDLSAQVLASEIDSLDCAEGSPSKPSKAHLTLDLSEGVDDGDHLRENDWQLLDCYFGIPLFDTSLNNDTCTKISSRGIFKQESLQNLLHSSRLLSLRLLDFITEWQNPSVITEMEMSGVPEDKEEHSAIYPTQNILFSNGALTRWMPGM